jgi:hypothetical protein
MSDAPPITSTGLSDREAFDAIADLRRLGIAEDRIKAAVEADGLVYSAPAGEGAAAPTRESYNINYQGVNAKVLSDKPIAVLDADIRQLFALLNVPAHDATSLAKGMAFGAASRAAARVPELHDRIEAYQAEQVVGAGAADRAKGVLDRARSSHPDLVNELEKRGAFSGRHAIAVLGKL